MLAQELSRNARSLVSRSRNTLKNAVISLYRPKASHQGMLSIREVWPLEHSWWSSPACTWYHRYGPQLFVDVAGLFAVVRQFLSRKILQAWCHMPRAPRLALKGGNHLGARTVALDDSTQPREGRQPSRQVSVGFRARIRFDLPLHISS